jgi:hypothetical protein
VTQEEQLEMLTRSNEEAQGDPEMQRKLEEAEREFSRLQAREDELRRQQMMFDEEVERLEREEREERERVEAEFERREGELRKLEERRRDLQKQAEERVQLVASNYQLWKDIQAQKKKEEEQKRRLEQELKDLNRKKHEKQKKEWELQEKVRLRGRQEKEENEKRIRERKEREKREKREREKMRNQITCAAKERNVNLPQGPGKLIPLPKAFSKSMLPKEYEVMITPPDPLF